MSATDPELQTGTVDRPNPFTSPTPATAANSTTLQKLEESRKRARLVIFALTTFAGLLLALPTLLPIMSVTVAGVFVVAAIVLFVAAVVVAYFTNSMTPEELERLLAQVAMAGQRLPQPAASSSPSDGAAAKRGPPEP